jgi:isopenicillin-N N-acyltransferase-like protein
MSFVPFFEEYARELLDEIRGVAKGACVPFADAMLVNVRGEVARDLSPDGCTAFSIAPEATEAPNGAFLGQNCDMDADMEPLWVILHVVPDDGPQILVLTFGGLVGYHGINELGVAQGVNSLSTGSWQAGLPHYPFKRLLLEQPDVAACVALARRVKLCSAANYVVADERGQVAALEIVPDIDCVRIIKPTEGVVVHGNHFLHPDFAPRDRLIDEFPDSPARQARFSSLTMRDHGYVSVSTLKNTLADHALGATGICRHDTILKTTASFIADIRARKLHACRGNPCCNAYTEYGFEA